MNDCDIGRGTKMHKEFLNYIRQLSEIKDQLNAKELDYDMQKICDSFNRCTNELNLIKSDFFNMRHKLDNICNFVIHELNKRIKERSLPEIKSEFEFESLSHRTKIVLFENGIFTFEQAAMMGKKNLLKYRNFGKHSLLELCKLLEEKGFKING